MFLFFREKGYFLGGCGLRLIMLEGGRAEVLYIGGVYEWEIRVEGAGLLACTF